MSLSAEIETYTAERRYRRPTVERWLALSDADGRALLDLAAALRLGENQLRDLWDWAEEIADRDASGIRAVLDDADIRRALRKGLGRADRLREIKGLLRRRRYPLLAEQEGRIAELIDGLALPSAVAVTAPEFLEGESLRVEMSVRSADELLRLAEDLRRAAASEACRSIFTLLDEAS